MPRNKVLMHFSLYKFRKHIAQWKHDISKEIVLYKLRYVLDAKQNDFKRISRQGSAQQFLLSVWSECFWVFKIKQVLNCPWIWMTQY
jgi:hypothetical protein